MERFNALGRGTQIMLISSVLLLVVSFFNWQEVEFDLGPLGEQSAGVSAWDDLGGILMGILTIVLLARIVANLAAVNIPVPVSFAMTSAVLAFLIFAITLVKVLTDDYRTFWAWLGLLLALLIAVGAWLTIQAAGGIESLKTEASSFGGSAGAGGGAATAAAPPPPAPPVETAPPPAPAAAEPPAGGAPESADESADTAGDEPSEERTS